MTNEEYEDRRKNAQGRDVSALAGSPYPLQCMDMVLSATGFAVQDVEVRDAVLNAHGVGVFCESKYGKKWSSGTISWLKIGSDEACCSVEQDRTERHLFARVWGHADFRDENIAVIKQRMADVLSAEMELLDSMQGHLLAKKGAWARP